MNRYTLDSALIKKNGRGKVVDGAFPAFTCGAGIEVNAKASELWIEIEAGYDNYEPWISVLVDGERTIRTALNKGLNRIFVFRGMNASEIKQVRVTKDMQAVPDDWGHKVIFKAVECEGELAAIEDRPLKLEFIGDSITSGEGLIGSKKLNDWISWCFDSVNSYTNLTAKTLNADYRVISQSGWGICSGWNNDPRTTLPSIYEKTCGSCPALKDSVFDSYGSNDFASWQPDTVIINLGTNDCGAFDQPEFTVPETGETYKNVRLADGSKEKASTDRFKKGAKDFLEMVRKNNPKAHILWCYGILGGDLGEDISAAIADFAAETGDKNIEYLQFPQMNAEQTGARFHPGIGAHRLMADMLIEHLKK